MMKHKFNFQIAYADTDAGGIVYHARYIEIAERARMDWTDGVLPPDNDIGFAVKKLNIHYKTPLKLGDKFTVETEIVKRGGASLDIVQNFVLGDIICATMNITVAYIGRDLKPKRIPDGLI